MTAKSCGSCAFYRPDGRQLGDCAFPVPTIRGLPSSVDYALISPKKRMGASGGADCPVHDPAMPEERVG